MGRIFFGPLASLLVIPSSPAKANTLEPPLYDLLLSPDHPSGTRKTPYETIKKYPSFCWIRKNKPPVDETIMFTLMDPRSTKPVLEIQLPNSITTETHEPCYCVNLKDYDIPLEPDIPYRWDITIPQKPEMHPQEVVVSGGVEGCAEEDCQVRDMASQRDKDFAMVLARRGFW